MPGHTLTLSFPAMAQPLSVDGRSLNFSSQLTEEKGTSPPDYRHYLQIWAKEKEAQKETIKDLPKMNQVAPPIPTLTTEPATDTA